MWTCAKWKLCFKRMNKLFLLPLCDLIGLWSSQRVQQFELKIFFSPLLLSACSIFFSLGISLLKLGGSIQMLAVLTFNFEHWFSHKKKIYIYWYQVFNVTRGCFIFDESKCVSGAENEKTKWRKELGMWELFFSFASHLHRHI